MANFKTHFQFATIGSGLASTLFLKGQAITPAEAILCWLGGSVGGILPDIDSDNSHSLAIVFGILSTATCVATVCFGIHHWPLLHVWIACIIAFFIVSVVIRKIFESFTVHRGIFHSLLAAVFTVFIVAVAGRFSGLTPNSSWFLAVFTGFGFTLHLILDEIYAVEFMNISVKRSFGSALKLYDYDNWKTAVTLILGIGALCFFLPPFDGFLATILNKETYLIFVRDFFPASIFSQNTPP